MSNQPSSDAANDMALPEVTFSTFVLSMASSALMHMGEVPNPETGAMDANPVLARHTIDVLTMLEDKINNGLNEEESKMFKDVLYELRMKFVARS